MTDSSPSLLNSLRRFQFKKKPQISDDSSNLCDKWRSDDTFLTPPDSDLNSPAESSTEGTDVTDNSVNKPILVNIRTCNQIASESSQTVSERSSNEQSDSEANSSAMKNIEQSQESNTGENYAEDKLIVKKTIPSSAGNCHSISDSEEENTSETKDTKGMSSAHMPAVTAEESDDDDVIFISNPRTRTPRPIVLSDDEDGSSTVPSIKQEPSNGHCAVVQTNHQVHHKDQQQEKEEPEVFVIDDDSNSMEIVEKSVKTEVKTELGETNSESQNEASIENGKRKESSSPLQPKAKKKKRRRVNSDSDDDQVRGEKVFDSDASSDEDITDELTESKRKVLNFLNNATDSELRLVPSCTVKKIEAITTLRPFKGWIDLVTKFQTAKFLGTNMLNGAQQVIEAREMVSHIMRKCERIATRTENAIAAGSHSITHQPSILNSELKLMPYQMVGLNWINVMCSQHLSGILADEMGLGKTIQVIAFLAHLKETGQTQANSPHLIVVPASTLENWSIEFEKWCPSLKVEQYYGSPEERKWLRHTWVKDGFQDTDVVLTTYSMVGSTYEERKMFRVVPLHYVVFDEAHMLKNMNTQRYENLIHINALHRLLLTGTPLQNNLLELMSLLVFVMPDMFRGKTDYLKFLFTKNSKQNIEEAPLFEQEQVQRAKRIMLPFVLRRLKIDVLRDLPSKTSHIIECPLEEDQAQLYYDICENARRRDDGVIVNSMTLMMDLRRMANHPLTLRYHYQDDTLAQMAQILANEPTYKETDPVRIVEDLQIMSDHQLHKLVKSNSCLVGFELADSVLVRSGKFLKLDETLPSLKANGHRVLIFSQFIFILDILEDYMRVRGHNFLRMDGSTPVTERQDLIDLYNEDSSIFVFLLSTKAGGIGINLTAADTVIIHDVDFNPYNDKQAEDRCHRMGQTRPVQIMRFLSKGTIEEAIMRVAQEKLHLEKEVTSIKDEDIAETINVAQLLRESLGITEAS